LSGLLAKAKIYKIPTPKRIPVAVALGRLGGSKGGKARVDNLTPERRKETAILQQKKDGIKRFEIIVFIYILHVSKPKIHAQMEEIFSSIYELQALRDNIPQFLFCDTVYPGASASVRKEVLKFKSENEDCEEIDVIVNSPGGLADDAYRIIRTFRNNFEQVNVIVPLWAKSAATLLSLGGSKIVLDEFAEFGPLDAQLAKVRDDSPEIERESALNDEHSLRRIETRFKEMFETIFVRLYEHKKINIPKSELSHQLFKNLSKFYEPLLKQIDPYKLGDKRRKLDIGAQYASRILLQFGSIKDQNHVRLLVDFLVDGCPDHGYVIDYDLIHQFLSNVYKPLEFAGSEYARVLSNLSLLIMEQEPNDYIGFVIKPNTEDDVVDLEGAGKVSKSTVTTPRIVKNRTKKPNLTLQ
jgi:hypothetical protein